MRIKHTNNVLAYPRKLLDYLLSFAKVDNLSNFNQFFLTS